MTIITKVSQRKTSFQKTGPPMIDKRTPITASKDKGRALPSQAQPGYSPPSSIPLFPLQGRMLCSLSVSLVMLRFCSNNLNNLSVFAHTHPYMRVCAATCGCVCVYVCAHAYVFVCVCVCASMCVCECVCVCVCV